MGWRTFFSAGKKFRATNKVARLLAAAVPSSFGHCGESRRKGSFTASVSKPARKLGSLADRLGGNMKANKWDERSNVSSCDRYGVSAAHATMSIFAETFAPATSLRTISEISSFSQPWRVTADRRLFAT
jgi:hypothetical protein